MGALLCCSCPSVWSQTPPVSPTLATPVAPPTPLKLPASLTNLSINFPNVPRGESGKLLESKVSFQVKDASFLSILDALLASAGTICSVEGRGLKTFKISMKFQEAQAGPLLDSFARAGGARLWVLPTKLILAPEKLLTVDEKKSAQLYGVLLSRNNVPPDSALGKAPLKNGKNILDIANTKVAVDFNNSRWGGTIDELRAKNGFYSLSATPPGFGSGESVDLATISASFPDITIGDALAFIAHANGCELYVKPNEFVICPPADLSPADKKQGVVAFTPSSTHFDFGPNANLDPSAKGS